MSALDEYGEGKCIGGELLLLSALRILIYVSFLGDLKKHADPVTRCGCLRSYPAKLPPAGRRRGNRAPSGEERPWRCLLRVPGHNSASTGPQLGRLPVYVKLKRRHVSLRP